MSVINYSCCIALVNENVRAIDVIFQGSNIPSYTYKSFDPTIKVGDYCVVNTVSNGYKVVEVVGVDGDFDFDSTINYKWIVGKIDIPDMLYTSSIEAEEEVIEQIKKGNRLAKREQIMKEQLILSEEHLITLKDVATVCIEDVEYEDRLAKAIDNGDIETEDESLSEYLHEKQ